MSWLHERLELPSALGGTIRALREFGRWEVSTGGNGQSSAYLDGLWKDALFRRLPKDFSAQRILMLGLATGRTLPIYRKRFPKARITAVELDPAMVALFDRIGGHAPAERPEILVGDAAEIVPSLAGPYDLIVFDMFAGLKVADATRSEALVRAAYARLVPQGALLVNAYREPDVFALFRAFGGQEAAWTHRSNRVALFRPWGAGTVGDPQPEAYRHFLTCLPYLERSAAERGSFRIIDAGPALGTRKSLPGLTLDHYVGDEEPSGLPEKPTRFRLTLWQPITRRDVPPGWRRWPLPGNRQLTGYALIPPDGPFHGGWSDHAKRHRARWKKQTDFEVADTDAEGYIAAFRRANKPWLLIQTFADIVRKKTHGHGDRLRLRIAKNKGTGEAVAGFASLWIPELRQTFHLTSFMTPAAQGTSAAFGLVDDAFRIAQERGDRVFEFDGFWAPGDPRSWKGFSRFKAQFGTRFVRWPKPLVKWR